MASHVVRGLSAALVLGSLAQVASGQERPNIVFMLSDDQAWYGLSVQMHPEMPNSKSDFHRTPRTRTGFDFAKAVRGTSWIRSLAIFIPHGPRGRNSRSPLRPTPTWAP